MTDVQEVLDFLADSNPEACRLEPASFYDRFISGVAYRFNVGPVLAYDMDEIIQAHVDDDGMTHEEAEEYFHFNTLGAWVGEGTPVFLRSFQSEVSDDNSRP